MLQCLYLLNSFLVLLYVLQDMLYRKLTWETLRIFPAAVRCLSTQVNTKLTKSSVATGAPLTLNSVRISVNGSFARVGYADLGCSQGAVCLALHGSPGTIHHMMDLAPALNQAGFRLLIPEFPGRILDQSKKIC